MKILADENMPFVSELFSHIGEIETCSGRDISSADVMGKDILLVRSVTEVNQSLIAAADLSFVGTATIGTDHIDIPYLTSRSIPFTNAAGCNAEAVVDYVMASVFSLAEAHGLDPFEKVWGIVGVGNVGGRLAKRLEKAGIKALLNDPPRAESEGSEGFSDLSDVLSQSDILCCHTPLVKGGQHATHHLLNGDNLCLLKDNAIIVNAGRGDVIDNSALLALANARTDLTLVLDVWEGEPSPLPALAARAAIATPHIAGYSLDGKARGTFMLYEACCQALGISKELELASLLPEPSISEVSLSADIENEGFANLIKLVYDPDADDARFRTIFDEQVNTAKAFDQLRKQYPARRELSSLTVGGNLSLEQQKRLSAIGFSVESLSVEKLKD